MNSCLTIGKEIEVDFESELQVLKFEAQITCNYVK